MHYYFCSTIPVALKIDGEFMGVLDYTPKAINIISSYPFVEAYPSSQGNVSITAFILNEQFLTSPPNGVIVTDFVEGFLITFIETPRVMEFSIVAQQKYNFALVTVFTQNGYNITIETPDDFYTQNIPLNNIDQVKFKLISDKILAVGFISDKNAVLVFNLNGKITKLLEKKVDEFSFDNNLTTTEKFLDIAKHAQIIEWGVNNGKILPLNTRLTYSPNFNAYQLPSEIIPYAFLEELMLNGNYDCYLAPNVLENKDKLNEYFGSFLGVCPPPSFICQKNVGIIYSNGKNKYKLKYVSFEITQGKITNILLQ